MDSLTKLPNRRFLWDKLAYEQRRFKRSRRPFSLVLADIDALDNINTSFGRDCGDFVLKSLSRLMSSTVREQDTISRWNGEEFLILLPETDFRGGMEMAERIRLEVEFRSFEYKNKILPVTLTFGVAVFAEDEDLENTLKRAEQALLAGKNAGKNCVMPKPVQTRRPENDSKTK